MNSSKWSFTGLAIVSATVGALGLLMTQNAIGLENEKAAPPAVSQTVTAPVRAFSQAFEAVASQVKPAVVSVYSEKSVKMNSEDWNLPFGNGNDLFRQFFGREWQGPQGQSPQPQHHEYKVPQHGMGSGMILDKQGHILTNYHVVSDVDKVKVQLADKREFAAEVVGTDPKSDVAIIRIKGQPIVEKTIRQSERWAYDNDIGMSLIGAQPPGANRDMPMSLS